MVHRLSLRLATAVAVAAGAAAVAAAPASAFPAPLEPPALLQKLAVPAPPVTAAEEPAAAGLGSPGTPEDDLDAALAALAAAAAPEEAEAQRVLALKILEGGAISGKAYSGIPLLNWNAGTGSKVRQVGPDGTVTVRQVRFGDHTLSDTWLLDVPTDQPYTITYEIADLAGAAGGELAPLALGPDGSGQRPVVQPLDWRMEATGTFDSSRFTLARGIPEPGAAEHTRTVIQRIKVAMPAPGADGAVVDVSNGPRSARHATAALLPAGERLQGAQAALGTEMLPAIAKLAEQSPERQIWQGLQDPATAQSGAAGLRPLVAEMRVRTRIPSGIDPGGADLTLAYLNNEVYISRAGLRPPTNGPLTVKVVNRDGFDHRFKAAEMHAGMPLLDLANTGTTFGWSSLTPLAGVTGTVAAGQEATFSLVLPPGSSALWLGDPDSGDQATATVDLERGPRTQGFRFEEDFTAPLHPAEDAEGNVWVTLEGLDKVAKISPQGDLQGSPSEEYVLPRPPGLPDSAPLAPHDVMVDGNGIVWVTLTLGNAIARIDPAAARPGTSDGIRLYDLGPCGGSVTCRTAFPPVPGEVPTRAPLQMEGYLDGSGATVIFFTEMNSDYIGLLRVGANGGPALNRVDFPCSCLVPLGIALDADGSVWFSEADGAPDGHPDAGKGSRIGRLRLDQGRPYEASTVSIDHYKIANCVTVVDPLHPPPGICTAAPHSLVIDGEGRVWYSGEATGRIGYLDPDLAQPDTSEGFTEFDPGNTDFDALPAPADLAVDAANRVYWSDEYGDIVGAATATSPRDGHWRPLERRSLTDQPMVDSQGNLWFVELGANLLTRVAGVAPGAGVPRPAPQPAFEASTSDDVLSAERLAQIDSVDVHIVRSGSVVASADGVPVEGGTFEIGPARWQGGGSDILRPGDRVRIQPHATGGFARRFLSFGVAELTASVQPDGSVAGQALSGGQPLADRVTVRVPSGAHTGWIDPHGDGAYRTQTGVAQAGGGSVEWAGASAAAIFTTITDFGAAAVEPAPPAEPQTVPPAPTSPEPAGQAPAPAPAAPAAPGQRVQASSCTWLQARSRRPEVGLLNASGAEIQGCFGRPTQKRKIVTVKRVRREGRVHRVRVRMERWRYGSGLELLLRRDRVTRFKLRSRSLRAEVGEIGVGSRASAITRALPGIRLDRRRRAYRGLVRQPDRSYADVVIRVSRGRAARVTEITALRRTGRRPRGVPVIRRAGR